MNELSFSFSNTISNTLASAWNNPWLPSGLLLCVTVASVIWSWRRRVGTRREHSALQRTLDSLPDAVALYNPKGQLTVINRKLLKMLPLETGATKARNRARAGIEDLSSTITFELPSFGRESLLIKEKATEEGGVAITVHGAQRHGVAHLNDPLTALPNRAHLLSSIAKRCSRTRDQLALIIVDLRGFRQINDSYGNPVGDELLKQTAIQLQHCMPNDALIARTAGDEFAALIEFDHDRSSIERRVSTFLATLRCGMSVGTLNLPVRACVGIAYAPEHGSTVTSLLKCADSACSHAKSRGHNSYMVYSSDQQKLAKRRHQLEVGLLQAIRKNELSLQYQPQIDVETRMTCGMEALLRWNSGDLGKVSPGEFIEVAEQTGIITRLGTWVMRQAIDDYQRLAQFGMSPATLSINLSRKQFDSNTMVGDIERLLDQSGFDPSRLCLEITETALFNDSTQLRTMLNELTSMGMKLAIDDFGVGYSSDVTTNSNSQEIIRAIVNIADSIGAHVVAEGIETEEQFDKIAELGCDRAQGYYLCEPMSATTFPDVMLSA